MACPVPVSAFLHTQVFTVQLTVGGADRKKFVAVMGFKVEAFHLGLPAYRQGSITFAMLVGGVATAWTLSARAVEALPGDGSLLRKFNLNRETIEAAAAQIAANLGAIPDQPIVIPDALLPSIASLSASNSVGKLG